MSLPTDVDVLVIGAGPAGTAAAALLHQQGLSTLILEREVLARLIRGEFELVDDREVVYYRNVYDHLVRYTELIEAAREMVSDLMETHLSAASNRWSRVCAGSPWMVSTRLWSTMS